MWIGEFLISIRTATEADIERILEIEQEAISPPWSHGTLLNEIYKNDSYFIVAIEDAGEASGSAAGFYTAGSSVIGFPVIGFAVIRLVGDDGELMQIAVDKTMKRRGTGGVLMKAIIDYAADKKRNIIFLEVRKSNDAAVGLYKKFGFKVLRTRKDYYTDPVEDAFIMSKTIIESE